MDTGSEQCTTLSAPPPPPFRPFSPPSSMHLLRDLQPLVNEMGAMEALHPSVAAFMRNPIMAVETIAGGRAAAAFQEPPADEINLEKDMGDLRHLIATMEEETRALHRAILELEEQTQKQARDFLTQLYDDLSIFPPDGALMANNTDLELEIKLSSLADRLLQNVRELEEKSALCRLDNKAMEEALHSLYVGISMEEERQKEWKRDLEVDEVVCNTLRLKLQEAHRRVFDYRQRETFVCAAEAKYLEQMEIIQRLRGELQACGLRLPVLEAGNTKESIITTCNRFRWERRCAQRAKAVSIPLPPGGVTMASSCAAGKKETNLKSNNDCDETTAVVSRVLALPPGVLRSLHNVTLGDAGGRRSEVGTGGSSGLRCRAQQLGLVLQYQQHIEASPLLRRSTTPSEGEPEVPERGGKGGGKATFGSVMLLIRGQRQLVDQFQLEVEAAVAALQLPNGVEVPFCDISPLDGEVVDISGPRIRDDCKLSSAQYQLYLSPRSEAMGTVGADSFFSSPPPLSFLKKNSSGLHPTVSFPASLQRAPSSSVWGESFLQHLSSMIPRTSAGITSAEIMAPASGAEKSDTNEE